MTPLRRAARALRTPAAVLAGLLGAFAGPAAGQSPAPRPAPSPRQGPGLPNRRYAPGDEFTVLSRIDARHGVPSGQGFVTLHRGYLLVVFSMDSGGGGGTGGFAFLDISDPRRPRTVFTTAGNPAYDRGSPNDARDIREAHSLSLSGDVLCVPTNKGRGTGVQFWDIADPRAPRKVGFLALPGLSGGDYAPTPWWLCWQGGRYVYVAGTSAGLYIVDASDPANPRLVDRGGAPNPIPVQQLGISRCNVVWAVGNLLLVAKASGSGFSLLDIGDPKNPVLLGSHPGSVGYSCFINGNRLYAADDPARVYDIRDPRSPTLLAVGPDVAEKGGYGMLQDGVFHYGSSDRYVKLDTRSTPFRALGTLRPRGVIYPDWDFATPLGNLVHIGNDHPFGSVLAVHSIDPDTTGPEVTMVSPPDGATGQPVTSRVGLTFSDQIDLQSVTPSTLVVRRRGGAPVPGRTSHQGGVVNFWPDQPLLPNAAYEVIVPAGGLRDFAGNPTPSDFRSTFFTGTAQPQTLVCRTASPGPTVVGQPALFQAGPVQGAPGPYSYRWDYGDGSRSLWSASPVTSHTYAAPGHYRVVLEVSTPGGVGWTTCAFTHTVHRPLAAGAPTGSSTLALDPVRPRVWTVNADNDTVSALDTNTLRKVLEVPVGPHPRTLAFSPRDGLLWVVCQDDASVRVLDPASGRELARIALPTASAPYGLAFSPAGDAALVTLEATGALLVLDPRSRQALRTISVGPRPRGIAVTADGRTALVARHVSPAHHGEVRRVDVPGGFVVDTVRLAFDPGPDAEDAGRGVPNYLASPAISPDGARAWVPAKKDNTARGLSRDGVPLSFENTVRAMAAQIDLVSGREDLARRIDFNDRDMPSAVCFSPLGDYAFVALQGSNAVEVRDAYDGTLALAIERVGRAPQGVLLVGDRLFVHGFLSRSVAVYDVGQVLAGTSLQAPELARVSTVASERLSPQVLAGKQLFYDASDRRMNLDGYLSCASCHLEGGSDGRVWDFTDRGEGLRNTIDLRGKAGTAHGPLHWTANFDEVQDFEHDIRGAFRGRGFLSDDAFHALSRSDALGTPKAGASPELDALAAYLRSLDRFPESPYRDANGRLTPDGRAGRAVFQRLGCAECHGGPHFTDSPLGRRHDVGTLAPSSGGRRGGPLDGLDTPTLRGLFATAPYFHDGSAATLREVIDRSG
ncbi:MAG: PKD domain-containing protein, partial [Planctomycetota bacterium]